MYASVCVRVSLEESLLVVEQAVHVALELGRGSAPDEAQLVRVEHALERDQRLDAQILATVLQTGLQVRQEAEQRSLVHNAAAHALGHAQLLCVVLVVIPTHGRTRRVLALHRLQTAHAAVLLQAHPIREEVLARRL